MSDEDDPYLQDPKLFERTMMINQVIQIIHHRLGLYLAEANAYAHAENDTAIAIVDALFPRKD